MSIDTAEPASVRRIAAAVPVRPSVGIDSPVLVRAASQANTVDGRTGTTRQVLADFKRGRCIGVTRLQLPAGRRPTSFAASDSTRNATLFVQRGRLKVHVGAYSCVLEPGDSLHFPLRCGYRLEGDASDPCEALIVESLRRG